MTPTKDPEDAPLSRLTVGQLKIILKALDVGFKSSSLKAELLGMVRDYQRTHGTVYDKSSLAKIRLIISQRKDVSISTKWPWHVLAAALEMADNAANTTFSQLHFRFQDLSAEIRVLVVRQSFLMHRDTINEAMGFQFRQQDMPADKVHAIGQVSRQFRQDSLSLLAEMTCFSLIQGSLTIRRDKKGLPDIDEASWIATMHPEHVAKITCFKVDLNIDFTFRYHELHHSPGHPYSLRLHLRDKNSTLTVALFSMYDSDRASVLKEVKYLPDFPSRLDHWYMAACRHLNVALDEFFKRPEAHRRLGLEQVRRLVRAVKELEEF